MAKNPKFAPPETPIANYNQGVVNWAYVLMKYDKPVGPNVDQYDPYYRYTVDVLINEAYVTHTWFTSVDVHKVIALAGAAKGSLLAVTNVKDGKRSNTVVMHSSGPLAQRTQEQVEAEVNAGLAKLQPAQQVLPPEQAAGPPPAVKPPAPPVPPPGQPPMATVTIDPESPAAKAMPPKEQRQPPPKQAKKPPPPNGYSSGPFSYTPMTDEEFEAWCSQFDDNARCILYAFKRLPAIATDMDIKVPPAQAKDLAVSGSIETWRQFGRGRSPLRGAKVIIPPPTAETKDGALQLISEMDGTENGPIKVWMGYTADPVDSLGAWKHAANIAKLFGVDSQVIMDEFDPQLLMNITIAIWTYQEARDAGKARNEALEIVAEKYDFLPREAMHFEEDE